MPVGLGTKGILVGGQRWCQRNPKYPGMPSSKNSEYQYQGMRTPRLASRMNCKESGEGETTQAQFPSRLERTGACPVLNRC